MAVISKAQFSVGQGQITHFPQHGFTITTSDANTYDVPITVFVGTTGVVRVIPWRGDQSTTVDCTVQAGNPVPFEVKAVFNTGTTATGLFGVC